MTTVDKWKPSNKAVIIFALLGCQINMSSMILMEYYSLSLGKFFTFFQRLLHSVGLFKSIIYFFKEILIKKSYHICCFSLFEWRLIDPKIISFHVVKYLLFIGYDCLFSCLSNELHAQMQLNRFILFIW